MNKCNLIVQFRKSVVVRVFSLLIMLLSFIKMAEAATDQWIKVGAENWTIESIVIDPVTPSTLYVRLAASTNGTKLFRSTDAGLSWNAAGDGNGYFQSLVIDPLTPSTLYAGTSTSQVYKSTNAGQSWQLAYNVPGSNNATNLAIDPHTPSTVYASTNGKVYKSKDAGQSWQFVSSVTPGTLTIDPLTTTTLYAATNRGVFKSTDAGLSWKNASNGLLFSLSTGLIPIKFLTIDPHTPSTLYLSIGNNYRKVFKSTDAGLSWQDASSGLICSLCSPSSLAIDPLTPTTLYLGTLRKTTSDVGVFKSIDAGLSWQADSSGLSTISVTTFATNSLTPATVYAGTGSHGLFKLIPGTVVPAVVDTDGDGLPDWYEDQYGFNKNAPSDAKLDADDDGLTNLQEYQIGTQPKIQDTDDDGVDDGVEQRRVTNPLDRNSRPKPSTPIGLNAQWGTVVPGLLNATLGWQHPGFRADGHNAEGVDKFILYRRKLLPDIDCNFNGFFHFDCQLNAVYDQVGEAPADRPGAVFTNLEDLVDVLDGWQFTVSAVNKFGEESDKSDDVVVVPFKDSETLRIKPPTEPIIFVHGIAGDCTTWSGAANTLKTLYGWTEGELGVLSINAPTLIPPIPPCTLSGDPKLINTGNFYRFTFPSPQGHLIDQGDYIGTLLNAISPNKKAILVAHSQGGLASRYYLQVVQKELGIPNRVSRLVTYGTPHQGSDLIAVGSTLNSVLNQFVDLYSINLKVDIPLFGHFEQFNLFGFLHDGLRNTVAFLSNNVDINSGSAIDLNPASDFISTISNFASYPLPDLKMAGITYVSLQGRVAFLTDEIADAARLTGNPTIITLADGVNTLIRDTDLVVSRENQDLSHQDLSQVPKINIDIKDDKQIKVFTRDPVNHFVIPKFKEGDDYIGVLMGLGYPVLSIQVHSPVTVAVVDPNGHFIAPQVNNLPGATYTFTGGVEIPMPIAGDYKIIVIPDPSASPTDTYTLDATLNGKTEVLVQNQQIQDIPPQGFIVPVTSPNKSPTASAGSDQAVRLGSLVTLDGNGSSDSDNGPSPLSFAWTKTAGPSASLTGVTTAKPQFTPSIKGFYSFDLVVNDGESDSSPASVKITVPTLGDIDLDGDVDNSDLAKITPVLNKSASGPNDLRDINGDMKIDALDTRKLVLLCTRPRCSI